MFHKNTLGNLDNDETSVPEVHHKSRVICKVFRKKSHDLRRGERKPASHLSLCFPIFFTQRLFTQKPFLHILFTHILFTQRLFTQKLLLHRLFTQKLFLHILFTHILFTQRLFTQKLFLQILFTHIFSPIESSP